MTPVLKAGMRLASVLATREQNLSQMDNLMDSIIGQMRKSDSTFDVAVSEYPGITAAVKNTLYPFLVAETDRVLPLYRQDLADFFSANLSISEINDVAVLYESPVGQKILKAVSSRIQYNEVAKEAISGDGDQDVALATLNRARNDAVKKTMAKTLLTREENLQLFKMSLTPGFRKFRVLLPQKQQIDAKWFNAKPPASASAKVGEAVSAAVAAYVQEADAKKAHSAPPAAPAVAPKPAP
jgi:Uncharacterized protein conserved in bacteria (DUF2059)